MCSPVLFLNASNKEYEKKIKKTIPITVVLKRIKYLGINLTKKVKDMYTENYKTLFKEIREHKNKWKDISCSWTGMS